MSDSDSEIRRAAVLFDKQLRHAIRVAEITGRMAVRDVMLLWFSHTTGVRVTELSLITLSDLMLSTGALRQEIYLRSAITKGCKARSIFLTHPKAVEAIERYLAYTKGRGWGTCLDSTEFRGFLPSRRLVLSHKGQAFELSYKEKVMVDGSVESYGCCDSLQQTFTRLYRQAGIKGASSHSGRRSLAYRVVQQTGDVEIASLLLGHASIEETRDYLDVDQAVIRHAFEIAL